MSEKKVFKNSKMRQTQTEEHFTKHLVWTPKDVNLLDKERQRNIEVHFQVKGIQREITTKCNG